MQKNIKNNEAAKLMKQATVLSVLVALSIIAIKLVAWVMTDSLSLLSSLVDSFLDVLASLVSFMAVRYALQPADAEHRFGHGKAEDIAAFAQSTFIAGSGLFILIEAMSRFITPHSVENEYVGIVVMVLSSVLVFALISFQKYVISKTNSSAIKADSLHYKTDLLVNFLVILVFLLSMFSDIAMIDPIFACIIALYILRSAWQVGREAFDKLMDREFCDEDREKIIAAVLSHPEAKGLHDLRTRSSGIQPFIQFHLELDKNLLLAEAHRISDEIEDGILKIFPNSEIIIHQDMEGSEEVSLHMGRVVKE